MKNNCSNLINCPGVGSPEPDWPVVNFSSETPDSVEFYSWVWPNFDPYAPPCLGSGCIPGPTQCDNGTQQAFDALSNIYAYSSQSQEYANLLAAASALGCSIPSAAADAGQETGNYWNAEKCATATCANGTKFTYCVPAGTLQSGQIHSSIADAWLAFANAWAENYAFQQASALIACDELLITPTDSTSPGGHVPGPSKPGYPGWLCFGAMLEPKWNTYKVTKANGREFTFDISSGSLPSGVNLIQIDGTSCMTTGLPGAPGIYTYTIQATSTTLPTITISSTYTLYVLGITNASALPDADVGAAYSEQLTASGGTAPYAFSVDPLDLPPGLSLASDGTLSGTPTVEGDYAFNVTIKDAIGRSCTKEVLLSIVAECDPFSSLVWTETYMHGSASGTFSGGDFTIAASGTATNEDSGFLSRACYEGNGNYNGPAATGSFHLYASGSGAGNPGGSRFSVEIYLDGALLIERSISIDIALGLGPGTYDFTFAIPNTGGVSKAVQVVVIWGSGIWEVPNVGATSITGGASLSAVCT